MTGRDPASNWRESWLELCVAKQELDSTVATAHWLGQKYTDLRSKKEKDNHAGIHEHR
jgi:hypothetical protein